MITRVLAYRREVLETFRLMTVMLANGVPLGAYSKRPLDDGIVLFEWLAKGDEHGKWNLLILFGR
jgi:hypothetical protein